MAPRPVDDGRDAGRVLQWTFVPDPEPKTVAARARELMGMPEPLTARLARADAPLCWESMRAEGITYERLTAAPPELVLTRIRTQRAGCLRWQHLLELEPNLSPERFVEGPWESHLQRWMIELLGVPTNKGATRPPPRPPPRPPIVSKELRL